MAKVKPQENKNSIDALNDQLTNIEQRVQNNQKIIVWGICGITAVVLVILAYIFLIRNPGITSSNDAIGKADLELLAGNDSIALQEYMNVADNKGYAAGNRAALNSAILLYKEGKYEEALKYLQKYDTKDDIVGAGAESLEGDCYVNLEKYTEALSCYDRAIKTSNKNPHLTPFFMLKKATVLEHLKNYSEAAAIYAEILSEYPEYGNENRIDIKRYQARAEQLAAAK